MANNNTDSRMKYFQTILVLTFFVILPAGASANDFGLDFVHNKNTARMVKQWDKIGKDNFMEFLTEKPLLSVYKVTFVANETLENPMIDVSAIYSKDTEEQISASDQFIYQYFSIKSDKAENIREFKIYFRISKQMLEKYNITKDKVMLYSYTINSDGWQNHSFVFVGEDNEAGFYNFIAEKNDMEDFVITVIKNPPKKEYIPQQEEREKEYRINTSLIEDKSPLKQELPDNSKAIRYWGGSLIITVLLAGILIGILMSKKSSAEKETEKNKAKVKIYEEKESGSNRLEIMESLVNDGWKEKDAKKLILETIGPDDKRFSNPKDEVKATITEARRSGVKDKEIRKSLKTAGWPEWKIDELLVVDEPKEVAKEATEKIEEDSK